MPSADTSFADTWIKPGEDAFRYWISFFPTAPLFGVEWRFSPFAEEPIEAGSVKIVPEQASEPVPVSADPEPSVEVPTVEAAAFSIVPDAEAEPEGDADPVATSPETPDDLKLIKGIGPGLEKQLNELGIYTFAQISTMDNEKLAWLDENLTTVKGRYLRDDWVGQASALMA